MLGYTSEAKRASAKISDAGASASSATGGFSVLDQPLYRGKREISLSFFAFLFAEAVKYSLSQVNQGQELEEKLHELGLRVGFRLLEYFAFKERGGRRDTKLLNVLTFISQTCWRQLFGHAGELLKGQEKENEYMITDRNLLLTRFVTVPRDFGHVSCAAYAAGIVEGMLCSSEFPAEVTAHNVEEASGMSTTILIRFLPEVIARDKRLSGG